MGRRSSDTSFEIQPGLYLKSQGGLLHCYFRIEGQSFRRSTRTNDLDEATQRAVAWYRNAQLRASLGGSCETVSFQKLAAAYGKHIEGLSKARYQLPTLKRHFLPYFADVRDISKLHTPEILTYFDHRRAKSPPNPASPQPGKQRAAPDAQVCPGLWLAQGGATCSQPVRTHVSQTAASLYAGRV